MCSITFDQHKYYLLLLRRDETPDAGLPVSQRVTGAEVPGVRCPLCKWRPKKSDSWTCWDCDHPEYFYDGCGTDWNTFETQGVCPTCLHRWQWTSCYGCLMWSRHKDWYENDES